jgi:hypothetical protein
MGKPRVRGSHAKIFVQDQAGSNIQVGEINKFSVKELGELKKSRAIGEHEITSTKTFEGYDLSFEGGKVDWKLAALLHQQDNVILENRRTPYFKVVQTIEYYKQGTETFTYPEVTIHGYNMDIDANDEITEKFEGFCGKKREHTKPVELLPDITAIITATIAKDSYPTS